MEDEKTVALLKSNLAKLKTKIIDTHSIIECYRESQQRVKTLSTEVNALNDKLALEVQEKEDLREMLEKEKKHGDVEVYKNKLTAVQDYNMQLQTEIDSLSSLKLNEEKMKTEIKNLAKENIHKDALIKSLNDRLKDSNERLNQYKKRDIFGSEDSKRFSMPSLFDFEGEEEDKELAKKFNEMATIQKPPICSPLLKPETSISKENLTLNDNKTDLEDLRFKYLRLSDNFSELETQRALEIEELNDTIESLRNEIIFLKEDFNAQTTEIKSSYEKSAHLQITKCNKLCEENQRLLDENKKMTGVLNDLKGKDSLTHDTATTVNDSMDYFLTGHLDKLEMLKRNMAALLTEQELTMSLFKSHMNPFDIHRQTTIRKEVSDQTYESITAPVFNVAEGGKLPSGGTLLSHNNAHTDNDKMQGSTSNQETSPNEAIVRKRPRSAVKDKIHKRGAFFNPSLTEMKIQLHTISTEPLSPLISSPPVSMSVSEIPSLEWDSGLNRIPTPTSSPLPPGILKAGKGQRMLIDKKGFQRFNCITKDSGKYFKYLFLYIETVDFSKLRLNILDKFLFSEESTTHHLTHFIHELAACIKRVHEDCFYQEPSLLENKLVSFFQYLSSQFKGKEKFFSQIFLALRTTQSDLRLCQIARFITIICKNVLNDATPVCLFLMDVWSINDTDVKKEKILATASVKIIWSQAFEQKNIILEAICNITQTEVLCCDHHYPSLLKKTIVNLIDSNNHSCHTSMEDFIKHNIIQIIHVNIKTLIVMDNDESKLQVTQQGFQNLSALFFSCNYKRWPWTYKNVIEAQLWKIVTELGQRIKSNLNPSFAIYGLKDEESRLNFILIAITKLSSIAWSDREAFENSGNLETVSKVDTSLSILKTKFETLLNAVIQKSFSLALYTQANLAYALIHCSMNVTKGISDHLHIIKHSTTLCQWWASLSKSQKSLLPLELFEFFNPS